MIGRTNAMGGGGIFGEHDAIVRVTAPAGSTVIFSRGAVTKGSTGHPNADDPSVYDYYFVVPQAAFSSSPWTVTGTLNGKTDSVSVVVDSADEYDVELIYAYFFLRNGVLQNGTELNGMSGNNITAPTITDMTGYKKIVLPSNSGVYFDEFDFSQYSTLYIDSGIVDPNNWFSWLYEGISSTNWWRPDYSGDMYAFLKSQTAYTRYTAQINISGADSTYKWLKIFTYATSSTGFELDLYNIYCK